MLSRDVMRSNEIKTSLTFNSFQTARTPRNRCSIQCIVFGRHLVPIRGPGGPGGIRREKEIKIGEELDIKKIRQDWGGSPHVFGLV